MFRDEVDGRYRVSLGETFYDFLILACRVRSRLVILWSLLDDPGMVSREPHRCEVARGDAEAEDQDSLKMH